MLGELALDECDQLVRGQRVQLDALLEQEVRLLAGRAVQAQVLQLRVIATAVEGSFGAVLEIEGADVGQPQTEIDDLGLLVEREAPRVALQCADDREAGLVEVVQHQQRHLHVGTGLSISVRAAVLDMPLVDMMARS